MASEQEVSSADPGRGGFPAIAGEGSPTFTQLDDAPKFLANFAADWGFDGAFYICGAARIDQSRKTLDWLARPQLVDAMPAGLGVTYREKFLGRDPLLVQITLMRSAVYWDRDVLSADLATAGKALFEQLSSHGMHRGLGVPVWRSDGRLGYFNYVSSLKAVDFVAILGRALRSLTLASVGFHEAAQRLIDDAARRVAGSDQAEQLSEREKEMLSWSVRGKTVADTAIIVGISEKTVQFHLSNCMRKLGASNKVEAATRAISLGLIST